MTDFEKEEFWKKLARLYDSTVNLAAATERLREIVRVHEKRLDPGPQREQGGPTA